MKEYLTKEIKNIVLIGSSGAGKTSFAEAMAFEGKVINRRGTVEEGTTISDFTEKEQQYKRSIYSSVLFSEFNGYKINVIDPPGGDDFCGSLYAAFKVVDVGIMLINAENGFEAGTEIQARYARSNKKPIIVFINHLDSEKADWELSYDSLCANSQVKPVIVQYPINPGVGFDSFIDVLLMKYYTFEGDTGIRKESSIPAEYLEKATELHNILVESAAENDEALMELYFDKGTLSEDEMREGIKLGLSRRTMIPVFCGSAKKDIGIKRLMEFVGRVAPGPLRAPHFETKSGKFIEPKESGPTMLFVYKSAVEQHLGEVSYFRVITGRIAEGMEVINGANGSKEKISQLYATVGKQRIKVSALNAGDLGCTVKLKGVKTNNTLNIGIDENILPIVFPSHRFVTAIRPKDKSNEEKLGELLQRAMFEDPSIFVEYSKELRQTILYGQGEHHINILKWSIENIGKVGIELFAPKIPYRETITKMSTATYRHKKQSGGSGQYGEVSIVIDPYIEGEAEMSRFKIDGKEIVLNVRGREEVDLPWGGKLIFYNCIVGGAIDTRFLPAVLKGLMEKMESGPLTGSYARDIRVAAHDGKMHAVDSNELSFRLAARNAFKDAFRDAKPKIMEPIYSVEILVPSDRVGDVMSDIQTRRGLIEGITSESGFEQIVVKVPLAELYKYSTTLSSITSGRATFTMKFDSYSQAPSDVQEKLLKSYIDEEDSDE